MMHNAVHLVRSLLKFRKQASGVASTQAHRGTMRKTNVRLICRVAHLAKDNQENELEQ